MEEWGKQLEPAAIRYFEDTPTPNPMLGLQLSTAISLKRIADTMEELRIEAREAVVRMDK